ncbi:MAG: SPFH domain-containing protein [Clostridiales bacterium]|nr:SPFH domain-containing protein [Clostridiales bacterium]
MKNIYWEDNGSDLIVHKYDLKNDFVGKGSVLTVRESQVAVFCDKGRLADVFLPGYYKLDTSSVPILTKLMSWKYGFDTPFRSDIYFVNTKQFTNEKWGTVTPIILRDKDYGAIRVRGYGTYSFKVDDAFVFMKELFGTNSTFKRQDISEYLRSMVIMGITDALGESKVPLLDMAQNLMELSKEVETKLQGDFNNIGLRLVKFNFQNFSLPEELEKMFDKSAGLGMMKNQMGTYMQMAQADALVEAAKNPGAAGSAMGAGLGFGMGAGMGQAFGAMYNGGAGAMGAAAASGAGAATPCPKCGAAIKAGVKFCPECGSPSGAVCPKCKAALAPGAKFCPECGASLVSKCPKCGADTAAGAKFCPECGERV